MTASGAREDVAASGEGWSSWLKGYVLVMLLTAAIFNAVDRQLVPILLQPIKLALHASDTEMGLLAGLYFSIFHALTSIPLARFADLSNRRTIIAVCVGLWSMATMACGLAQSYVQLALARMFVAIGEGGSGPATLSILSQVFSIRTRTRVFALISSGSAIGMGLGIFLGGTLNDLLGWRGVFLVVGAPGLLFALLFRLTIKEPVRTVVSSRETRPSLLRAFAEFWRMKSFRLITLMAVMGASTGFALLGWAPAFFIRLHGMSSTEVGQKVGLATVLGLFFGNMTAGYLADHLGKRDPRWPIYVSAIGSLALLPFVLLMVLTHDRTIALVSFGFFMYFDGFFAPCLPSAVMGVVDARARALASACVGLCVVIGGAIGPSVVGATNDLLHPSFGVDAIRISIAISAIGSTVAGVAGLIWARVLKSDYKAGEASK